MPPHILIVDDEPWVAFFLYQVLKSTKPDYVVSTAQSAAQALELAEGKEPDLMIIDYRLKDMDGLALVATLKRLGSTAPVIMITAGPPPVTVSATDSEILHCIQKPFSTAQLITVIGEALETGDSTSVPGDGRATGRSSYAQEPNRTPAPGDGGTAGRDRHPRGPSHMRRPSG